MSKERCTEETATQRDITKQLLVRLKEDPKLVGLVIDKSDLVLLISALMHVNSENAREMRADLVQLRNAVFGTGGMG